MNGIHNDFEVSYYIVKKKDKPKTKVRPGRI